MRSDPAYCLVRKNEFIVNGETIFRTEDSEDFSIFLKNAYKHFSIDYPVFYKMDCLNQITFLAIELLLMHCRENSAHKLEKTAVILANSTSTVATDYEYVQTYAGNKHAFASPALFRYTLPNMTIAQLCIRQRIKGENTFFVFETFDRDFLFSYAELLFAAGKAEACITGWVDYISRESASFQEKKTDEYCDAVFYFYEKSV